MSARRRVVLVQIEEKDGKLQGKALSSPLLRDTATIENVKGDDKSIEFDVKYRGGMLHVRAYPTKNKTVLGSISFRGQLLLAQLTKTDDKKLTLEGARSETAGRSRGCARRCRRYFRRRC